MEVMVHLCSQQTRNLSTENPSGLSEIKGDLVKHSIWQFGKLTKVLFTLEKYQSRTFHLPLLYLNQCL